MGGGRVAACTIPPRLFGVRAIVSVLVFAVCVYVACLRAPHGARADRQSIPLVNGTSR